MGDSRVDLQIAIAGAAGEGIQTIGEIVSRVILSHGWPVITGKEYESRIRGGNNSYHIRIGSEPPPALNEQVDILLPLSEKAAVHYADLLHPGSTLIKLPFPSLAEKAGGSKLYANTAAAGALIATIGIELSTFSTILEHILAGKGEKIVQGNLAVAKAGYETAGGVVREGLSLPKRDRSYFFLSAQEAIPLAAAYAGCRFISAYPMSPSTGIITAFARDEDLSVFTEQAEDEIAAVNMAIGASYAGTRAMTATSGGGFALMTEAVSLAGMVETPLVIVLAQRPGPATGLPTRTAQEDLLFSINAGHGEFPKVILAPADPKDAFEKMVQAFELADRYQCPVIVLTDQYLADTHFSYTDLPIPKVADEPRFADPKRISDYKRYDLTEDGISPRLYPGQSEHLVGIDSDEHDEYGHITEDLRTIRPRMVEKRMRKCELLKNEIAPPEGLHLAGAKTVLIGWGSTRGAIREAVKRLRDTGRPIGALHFTELWPLPEFSFPADARHVTVEGNATGQLARLLVGGYRTEVSGTIGRSDGLPITADWLQGRINA